MTSLAKPVPIRCVLLVPLALGLLRVSGGFTLIFFSGRLFLSQAAMQALPPAHFDMFLLPRIMVKTCLLLLPGGLILPFNFAERTGKVFVLIIFCKSYTVLRSTQTEIPPY